MSTGETPEQTRERLDKLFVNELEILLSRIGTIEDKRAMIRGAMKGVRRETTEEIANFVERSKRADNCSLAREIRAGKYRE